MGVRLPLASCYCFQCMTLPGLLAVLLDRAQVQAVLQVASCRETYGREFLLS